MFCKHCGTRLPDGAQFCPGCGVQAGPRTAPAVAEPPSFRPAVASRPKSSPMDWLLLVAAVLVILFGVGHIALTVGGSSTTAQVTACEQVLYTHDDDATRNPSRYKLEYQFSVNGEPYTGSVTRVFAGGTHMRQTVPVHYLPIWPHINAEERGASPVGPVTLGAGMLMLVLGIRRKPWARG